MKLDRVIMLFVFAIGLLAGAFIGQRSGRSQASVTETPFVQARVAGGEKCVAIVRYGVSAEKGCDANGDKWTDCTKEVVQ